MVPDRAPSRTHDGGGDGAVAAAAQRQQLARAPRPRSAGLSNQAPSQSSIWSAPSTRLAGGAPRDPLGLQLGQRSATSSAGRRRRPAALRLVSSSSTARRDDSTQTPACSSSAARAAAGRGEHQIDGRSAWLHGGRAPATAGASSSCMMVAAVSSIERRVTSITGQLASANRAGAPRRPPAAPLSGST